MLQGHEVGTRCSSAVFLVQTFLLFLRKMLLRGQNFIPQHVAWNSATCSLNTCIMKQGQSDLNFQCRIVCTALTNCSRYNIEMSQYPLCVHQLAYCPCNVRPMRTHKRTVPTSCPCNIPPIVCADFKCTQNSSPRFSTLKYFTTQKWLLYLHENKKGNVHKLLFYKRQSVTLYKNCSNCS